MKEKVIKFETAILAKEKGFDWNTTHWYNRNEHLLEKFVEVDDIIKSITIGDIYKHIVSVPHILAPTQNVLQKWLRDIHKIEISITPTSSQLDFSEGYNYYVYDRNTTYEFWSTPDNCVIGEYSHSIYEDALEESLLHSLNLINKI